MPMELASAPKIWAPFTNLRGTRFGVDGGSPHLDFNHADIFNRELDSGL